MHIQSAKNEKVFRSLPIATEETVVYNIMLIVY